MKDEIWNKWMPNKSLSRKYYVDKIFDEDRLEIYLSDDKGQSIIVIWDCIVESYICTEEVNRSKNYNRLTSEWTFFEIYNSKYIAWLVEESNIILDTNGLKHICIVSANSVIDVIAFEYPEIVKN